MPGQGGGGGNNTPIIILAVVVVLAAIGGGAFFLLSGGDDGSPEDAVRSYISAASEGDCDGAFEHVTPDLQNDETCSPTVDPAENVNVTTTSEEGDSAIVDVSFTTPELGQVETTWQLTRSDGDWLISSLSGPSGGGDGGQAQPDGGGGGEPPPEGGADPGGDPGVGTLPEAGEPLDGAAENLPDDGSASGPSGGGDSSGSAPGAAAPAPSGTAPDDCLGSTTDCDTYVQPCHDGDMAACDELYATTGVGTAWEDYGATCGGRSDVWISRECESTYGPQV